MKKLKIFVRSIRPKLKNLLFSFQNKIRNNSISYYSVIAKGSLINNCRIAAYTYIGQYCILNSVNIGKYSSVAPYVMIGGAEHSYWWYSTSHFISKYNIVQQTTTIGNDVWIGAHSVIRQGIHIGNGAVIGAGSVVLHDVEPYSIVVGVPAKKIKMRFDEKTIYEIENSRYWDYDPKRVALILNDLNKTLNIHANKDVI